MSVVYLVQNQHHYDKAEKGYVPKFNFSSAERYGRMVELLSPTAAPFNCDAIMAELRAKMANFSAEDYLLLIGNPVLIGLSSIVAKERSGQVNFLQWSGKQQGYIPLHCLLE